MPNVKRTFTIPDEISTELDKTIPSSERSKFIARTLREALQDKNVKKLLKMLDTIPRAKNPKGIRSEDLLREIRDGRAKEIIDNS